MKGQSLVGTLIAGRYELLSVAGAGGMGVVYKARQIDLDRIVAVKFLDADFVSDQEMYSRFQLEARALSQISHKNVGAFYTFAALETGEPFIVMEYLEGQSLSSILSFGALAVDRVLKLSIQIADGMSCAHKNKLVHRDLKPGNILLVSAPEFDTIKVVDFGLAKHIETSSNPAYTRTGQLVGTPQYLSPEQCRGEKNIDARADIYAFGCVIYEMLFGVPPFDADSPVGYLYLHLNQRVSFPDAASKDDKVRSLCRVIQHCMEKEANDRYGDMQSVKADLSSIGFNQYRDLSAPPVVFAGQGKKRVWLALIVVITAAVIVWSPLQLQLKKTGSRPTAKQLLGQIKDAEKQHDKSKEMNLINALKQHIKQKGAGVDAASSMLLMAQELEGYPVAANSLALAAIFESFAAPKFYWKHKKDVRYDIGDLDIEGALSSNSVEFRRITEARLEKDSSKVLPAASIIESASKILLANNYCADRNLLLNLLSSNNIGPFISGKGFYAFYEFLTNSADNSRLPPSEALLDLYKTRVRILRRAGKNDELDSVLKKAVSIANALYGENSGSAVVVYLYGLNEGTDKTDITTVARLAELHAIKQDPSWVFVYHCLAQESSYARQWNRVIEFANKGIALEPNREYFASFLYQRGGAYNAQRRFDKSMKDFKEAYRITYHDLGRRWQYSIAMFDSLWASGSKKEANTFIEAELKELARAGLLREQSHVFCQVGEFYLGRGDLERAKDFFERGLALSPSLNDPELKMSCTFWLLSTENQGNSLTSGTLQKALAILKGSPGVWVGLLEKSDAMIQNAFRRYQLHNLNSDLKESAGQMIELSSSQISNRDSTKTIKSAISTLEIVQECAGKSESLTKELERLKKLTVSENKDSASS